MTPNDRLDAAEAAFDNLGVEPTDLNYAPLQALIAIGRLLQEINDRQAAAAV